MTKILRLLFVLSVSFSVMLAGCSGTQGDFNSSGQETPVQEKQSIGGDQTKQGYPEDNEETDNNRTQPETTDSDGEAAAEEKEISRINMEEVRPNEVGKIMVVMFHNFIEEYKTGDKEYTTTFQDFRELLQTLYDKDYRLINVGDYLNNDISVPAGCIPMIFTFDDGTSGQFNLVEENGKLVANPQSAVGIMEEFNKDHPDFGLKGTFYVNLGLNTFEGEGTLGERMKYLTEKGFEIGNHTLTHIMLNQVKSAETIQKEIGGNQKKMYELIPGYKMVSFSLPYGLPSEELKQYVYKGEYEGVKYENLAVMEVGWDPALSPVSKDFNPLSTHRVRASGIEPVDADLAWWLERLSRDEQYVSDGNADTVAVPKAKEDQVDKGKLKGKELIVY
ncbi:MAG: polysaccharide deacetylase family protein [Acetivibrionales bacterium]